MRTFVHCLAIAALLTASASVIAQPGGPPPPPSPERLKEIKAQRTAYLTTKLGFSVEEAQQFWPLYNEFDDARHALREQMRETHEKLGDKPTEQQAKDALAKGLQIRHQEVDLERTYQERFIKAIGATRTLELHRAERDFNREVLHRFRERGGPGPEERRGQPPHKR